MSAPRRGLKGGLAWVVLFLITLVAVSVFWRRETGEVEILYSELRAQITSANIASITIDVREVHGEFKEEIVVLKRERGIKCRQVILFKIGDNFCVLVLGKVTSRNTARRVNSVLESRNEIESLEENDERAVRLLTHKK